MPAFRHSPSASLSAPANGRSTRPPPGLHPTSLDVQSAPWRFDAGDPFNIATSHLRVVAGVDIPADFTPVDDDTVIEHWVEFFVDRILSGKDTVFIVDGEAGEGKSTFTLWFLAKVRRRLSERLRSLGRGEINPLLNLDWDVIYDTPSLLHRIYTSSKKDPAVILVDEGSLAGFQAGAGLSEIGRAIDKALSVCRIKAVTAAVLNPSVWGLAPFVRNRRAKVYFHVEERGVSTAHTLKTAIDYKAATQWLPFKKAKAPWAKLYWPSLESDPIWGPYEKRKLDTVQETLLDLERLSLKFAKKEGANPSRWPWAQDYTVKPTRQDDETDAEYTRRSDRARKKAEYYRKKASGKQTTSPSTNRLSTDLAA